MVVRRNANLRCWCLNFGGRVRLPSARNFQLCLSSPPPPQHPPHHLHHHHQGGGVHHVPAPAGAQAGAGAAPPGGGNLDPLLLLGPEHEHFSRVILQFGKVRAGEGALRRALQGRGGDPAGGLTIPFVRRVCERRWATTPFAWTGTCPC